MDAQVKTLPRGQWEDWYYDTFIPYRDKIFAKLEKLVAEEVGEDKVDEVFATINESLEASAGEEMYMGTINHFLARALAIAKGEWYEEG